MQSISTTTFDQLLDYLLDPCQISPKITVLPKAGYFHTRMSSFVLSIFTLLLPHSLLVLFLHLHHTFKVNIIHSACLQRLAVALCWCCPTASFSFSATPPIWLCANLSNISVGLCVLSVLQLSAGLHMQLITYYVLMYWMYMLFLISCLPFSNSSLKLCCPPSSIPLHSSHSPTHRFSKFTHGLLQTQMQWL